MCILETEMEVGSLIVSLDLPVVETVENWEYLFAPDCHSGVPSELRVHSDIQGQVCACSFR